MVVATIGAASLAPVFQELCNQITQAIQINNTKLKPILVFLISTLNSCRDRVILPVQLGRRIMFNQDHLIESAVVEFQKAAKLVAKLSTLRSWRSFWNLESYAEKLLELDRHVRSLMEATWMQEVRIVRQQSLEVRDLMDGMLGRMFDAYNKAVVAETTTPPWRERVMSPFLEEMAAHNRVLGMSIEEVRSFRVEMEKGLEVVRRSGGVGKKYECVVGLLGLNQCLQREVGVMRRQMARNAVESLEWVRKMEKTVSEVVSIAGVQELAGVSGTA